MLCSRSAILISTTLMSSLMVRSSLRKFSACADACSPNMPPDIFVSPATIWAILNYEQALDVLHRIVGVLHHVVEQGGAYRCGAEPISWLAIFATAIGWSM